MCVGINREKNVIEALREQENEILRNLAKSQEVTDLAVASMYDAAKAYHTTVLTIGYAGFFAIWAFSREYLPQKISFLVGASIGISIVFYVVFEIFQMLYLMLIIVRARQFLVPKRLPGSLADILEFSESHKINAELFQNTLKKSGLFLIFVWPFFFIPSLFSGFGGGLLLLYNFFAHIFGWDYWPSP